MTQTEEIEQHSDTGHVHTQAEVGGKFKEQEPKSCPTDGAVAKAKSEISEVRKKQRYLIYLFLSFVSLGLVIGVHGPTFLDLVMILNVDIETGSVLFTGCAVGYVTGSLIGGVLYDKVNKELTLFVVTLFMGVFTLLVPWCRPLGLMVAMNAARGCMEGVLDADVNAIIFDIWGKKAGPYMQAVQFAFGLGATLSPFAAKPFLAEKPGDDSNSVSKINSSQETTTETGSYFDLYGSNNSAQGNLNATVSPGFNFYSDVHIPYLIIGVFCILTAFPFVEMFKSRKVKRNSEQPAEGATATTDSTEEVRHIPLTTLVTATFIVLIGMFYISYACVEDTFTGFIMAFVVEHLKWEKGTGTVINSVYWISFSVGRLLAIFIAKCLTPWKMLVVDFIFFNLGFLTLFLGAQTSNTLCWIGTVITGLAMGSVFPTGLTWIDARILKVTGKISSYILVCASIGMTVNPIIVGYLFDKFTPMWFIYLLFGQTVLCTAIFAIKSLIVFWIHRNWKGRSNREEDIEVKSPTSDNVPHRSLIVDSTDM